MGWGVGWDSGAAGSSVFASGITVGPGAPGIDTTVAGQLELGKVNATSVKIDQVLNFPSMHINGVGASQQFVGDAGGVDMQFNPGNGGAPALTLKGSGDTGASVFGGHLISSTVGAPVTSALGANVTSATFTGNDTRGTIAIVMAGGLAANTRVATCTFAQSYGATSPKVTLVDQTSGVGLAVVNSYVLAQATGVSFDLAFDQALVAGTYIIDYIVIG